MPTRDVCFYWIYFGGIHPGHGAHVADCSYIEPARPGQGASRRAGPDWQRGRFACQSRMPASFAMGFIPAITLRIYPLLRLPPLSTLSPPPFGLRPLQISHRNCRAVRLCPLGFAALNPPCIHSGEEVASELIKSRLYVVVNSSKGPLIFIRRRAVNSRRGLWPKENSRDSGIEWHCAACCRQVVAP